MKRTISHSFLVLVSILFIALTANAQSTGKIAGKITDKKTGEPLIGVTVLVQSTGKGAVTDVEGRYIITVTPGTYVVDFKYMGYQTKSISDVKITTGAPVTLDVVMDEPSSKALQEVVVRGSFKQESINALLTYQKNTNTVAQVVSAESIKKSPDRNTSEVLKRVSGASIQEGKYIIIRGLADRYNQATLNGALLSSTDPDRKTFAFDLFPSNIVDNIIINKAATPDMPGEFAGGLVQVNTKDIPDANFLTLNVGTGFNGATVGKEFFTYKGGKYDFLGFDDGSRLLSNKFPSIDALQSAPAAQRAEYGKSLGSVWGYNSKNAPINSSLQVTGGFSSKSSGSKRFGGVFSLNYNKQNRFINTERRFYDATEKRFDYSDKVYAQNILLGGLANIVYQSGKNKFSWKNSYNITGSDQTILRTGIDNSNNTDVSVKSSELSFKSNRLLNSQLIGEHFLSGANVKIKWNGNFSWLKQDLPDLRRLVYTAATPDAPYYASVPQFTGNPRSSGRFFSNLDEKVYGGTLDLTKSFKWLGANQQIKIGGLYQRKNRDFDSRAIAIVLGRFDEKLLLLPPDKIFAPENFSADKFYLDDLTTASNAYTSFSNLGAGYIQFDLQFNKLRFVGGGRFEAYEQSLTPKKINLFSINKANDFLPSVNFTYELNRKTNIRLSASQTVARPEFREIAPFSFYDFEKSGTLYGNTKLERTKITNIDLRYELYPAEGEVVTIAAFYKNFDKPIESTYTFNSGSPIFSYANAQKATSIGGEIEFRKKLNFFNSALLEHFTLFANVAYIHSKVEFPAGFVGETSRPMQGQSPYLVNAGLQFDHESTGTNASLLFNRIGRRIAQVGNSGYPSIWENPRSLLDFQVSQRIFKNAELKIGISDILNQRGIFYQDIDDNKKFNEGKDYLINRFNYGTNYSISVSFNLNGK
ncbi:outer membrane beta-barrel protein [Chitinophaga pendula]|uniref:TonB-dependent receptor n=1 Tax=Chitinophaga TaxID=79328 RepID=UPI000BAECA49|nr:MULTISPECIES: TonB-dependent receptor [Chitinophaga]ASZ09843.1 hypothetical protein CK934_02040 [Chitinophaga sp. MD30]UCJ07216.1 outer membrane beta-barrel protein [Chitinophaga pendula]